MSNPDSEHLTCGLPFDSSIAAGRLCPFLDADDESMSHRPIKAGAYWYIRMMDRETGEDAGII